MAVTSGLVLDTSVWINLLATEQQWTILDALGVHCIVPEQVVREVRRNPITRQTYSLEKHPLRRQPNIEVVELCDDELDLFLSLVAEESPNALGDGEAAAIAIAWARRCPLALDDRKARRIVRERCSDINILMTVDILSDRAVKTRLGEEACNVAFEKAKQFGRMHVPKNARNAI
jgi:predicted nucleic acid-binding protein